MSHHIMKKSPFYLCINYKVFGFVCFCLFFCFLFFVLLFFFFQFVFFFGGGGTNKQLRKQRKGASKQVSECSCKYFFFLFARVLNAADRGGFLDLSRLPSTL